MTTVDRSPGTAGAGRQTDEMRKQYHFWPSDRGRFDAWDVGRLIELARGLPVIDLEVESIHRGRHGLLV